MLKQRQEQDEVVGAVCVSAECVCLCRSMWLSCTYGYMLHISVYVCAYWEYWLHWEQGAAAALSLLG